MKLSKIALGTTAFLFAIGAVFASKAQRSASKAGQFTYFTGLSGGVTCYKVATPNICAIVATGATYYTAKARTTPKHALVQFTLYTSIVANK